MTKIVETKDIKLIIICPRFICNGWAGAIAPISEFVE